MYQIRRVIGILLLTVMAFQPVYAKEVGTPYLSVDYAEAAGVLTISGTLKDFRASSVVSVVIRRLNDDEIIYMDDQKVKSDGSFILDPVRVAKEPGLKKYYISYFDGSQTRGFSFGGFVSEGCEADELIADIKSVPAEYLAEELSGIYTFFGCGTMYEAASGLEDDVKIDIMEYIRVRIETAMSGPELQEVLKGAVACTAVQELYWGAAKEILNKNLSFDKEVNGYESLTALQQDLLFRNLSGKTYPSYRGLIAAAEEFVRSCKNETSDKDNHGGGGRGGSSGSGGGGNAVTIQTERVNDMPQETPPPEMVFNDLAEYEWAEQAINSLAGDGIINGIGNGRFEPGRNISRAEFLKIAVELFAIGAEAEAELPFADVSDQDWYYRYLRRAYGAGLVFGDGSVFNGNDYITRQDIAVILSRKTTMAETDFDPSVFSDWSAVAPYALDAMKILCSHGVLNGYEGRLNPEQYATRAEAAVMIYNFKSKES